MASYLILFKIHHLLKMIYQVFTNKIMISAHDNGLKTVMTSLYLYFLSQ